MGYLEIVQLTMFSNNLINLSESLKTSEQGLFGLNLACFWCLNVFGYICEHRMFIVDTDLLVIKHNG